MCAEDDVLLADPQLALLSAVGRGELVEVRLHAWDGCEAVNRK